LVIGLVACGGAAQPEDSAPVVAKTPMQEEIPDETEEPAPRPELVSVRHVTVEEERERYTIHQALYEGGEELVVHWDATIARRGDMRTYSDGREFFESDKWIGYNGIITVENSAGDNILQIQYPIDLDTSWGRSIWLSPSHSIGYHPPLWFADLNFDGYLDLVISVFTGGMAIPVSYRGFIWYPELGRFVEAESFRQIHNFLIDEELQALRGHSRRDAYRIWRYIDGNFVVTNELQFDDSGNPFDWGGEPGDGRHGTVVRNFITCDDGYPSLVIHWETHLVDGEMVSVWPIISDTEEGRAIIYEHLFGEDSIWFPRR